MQFARDECFEHGMTYRPESSPTPRDTSGQIRLGPSEKLVTNSYSSEKGPSLISLRGTSHCQCCHSYEQRIKTHSPTGFWLLWEKLHEGEEEEKWFLRRLWINIFWGSNFNHWPLRIVTFYGKKLTAFYWKKSQFASHFSIKFDNPKESLPFIGGN